MQFLIFTFSELLIDKKVRVDTQKNCIPGISIELWNTRVKQSPHYTSTTRTLLLSLTSMNLVGLRLVVNFTVTASSPHNLPQDCWIFDLPTSNSVYVTLWCPCHLYYVSIGWWNSTFDVWTWGYSFKPWCWNVLKMAGQDRIFLTTKHYPLDGVVNPAILVKVPDNHQLSSCPVMIIGAVMNLLLGDNGWPNHTEFHLP